MITRKNKSRSVKIILPRQSAGFGKDGFVGWSASSGNNLEVRIHSSQSGESLNLLTNVVDTGFRRGVHLQHIPSPVGSRAFLGGRTNHRSLTDTLRAGERRLGISGSPINSFIGSLVLVTDDDSPFPPGLYRSTRRFDLHSCCISLSLFDYLY